MLHVALIAPHYSVGSFDDDASYILGAKALLAGQGLTGHTASGQVVVGLYPPGYSALLAPLVWLWPHSFGPLRALSVLCYAAVFPLLWVYLVRHRVVPAVRVAALLLLALGPPFATYGSMVMAEGPFLVVLLLLLLATDRWLAEDRVLTGAGVATVVAAAALVWVKQAAIAAVLGLLLWVVVTGGSRRWRRSLLLGAGLAAALGPVLVARLIAGVPLAGSRYSAELGAFYSGGLLSRVRHVLPASAGHLLSTALPETLLPYLTPLPINDHWPDLWKAVSWQVTVFVVVGAVVWFRRHRDASLLIVVAYLGECVLWPYVNERRTILVLPLLVTWYAVGVAATWRALRAHAGGRSLVAARISGATLALAAVVVPLGLQLPRDYLYALGQSSSRFGGSRYVAILAHLGSPSDVVETDYQSSVALFTGHRTNWNAFEATVNACYLPGVLANLSTDRAAYLLVGDVNKPGVLDRPCLLDLARTGDWAVPVLHTARDDATVFELYGPYTGHPHLASLAGADPSSDVSSPAGTAVQWDLGDRLLSQASVGEAALGGRPTGSVRLQVESPDGAWRTVASSGGPVGDGGSAPYLLADFSTPMRAAAARVVLEGVGGPVAPAPVATAPGAVSPAVADFAALGPS